MPTQLTIRMNLHLRVDSDSCSWSLLLYTPDPQGVPHARMLEHGIFDLSDLDLVGIEAVAQALAVAADQRA